MNTSLFTDDEGDSTSTDCCSSSEQEIRYHMFKLFFILQKMKIL